MRGVVANGKKITALRMAAGLTQELLAADSCCDTKTLRSAEHSHRMDVATLRRIAQGLGVDVCEIISAAPSDVRDANIAAAERFLRAFNARRPDAVADSFCEDGVIVTLADPALPGTGEFRGREQIRRWAETCFETFRADPVTQDNARIDAAGDFVFVRLERPRLEYLPTGAQANVYLASEFKIADGLIAALWIFPESGAIERMALRSQAAGAAVIETDRP
jgi:transcriptional regulator with XRE-family HTH domain